MATKPRSEWSEAYRRRVERAEAAGKTRQAARGHRAAEHRTRKARGALTTVQKERVKRFARSQAERAGVDYSEFRDTMLRHAEAYGMPRFDAIMNKQRQLLQNYKKHPKRQQYNEDEMSDLIGMFDEADDPRWLYYH